MGVALELTGEVLGLSEQNLEEKALLESSEMQCRCVYMCKSL